MSSPYRDKRSDFFKKYFEQGLAYQEYLATGEAAHQERWHKYEQLINLTPEQKKIISNFKRKMNIIVMSGTWCGDCSRQGPMFYAIEKAYPPIVFRFLENKANPDLLEELRVNGAEKVPVVVSLSEDFYEVGRFSDKHLSVYRKTAATQLGPACETGIVPASKNELETELEEWVAYFERLQWMLRLSPALRRRYND